MVKIWKKSGADGRGKFYQEYKDGVFTGRTRYVPGVPKEGWKWEGDTEGEKVKDLGSWCKTKEHQEKDAEGA